MKNFFRLVVLRLECWRYREQTYHCPLCGHHVPFYLPLPSFYHQFWLEKGFVYSYDQFESLNVWGYRCPWCGASDRERLMALWVKREMSLRTTLGVVLDFAPSPHWSDFIKEKGKPSHYRTADLLRQEVDDRVDIQNLPYQDGYFDHFFCSHILEHIPDDLKAMRELYRVLKPGGWGVILVPIIKGLDHIEEDPDLEDEDERWRRFGQGDHLRIYNREGLVSRLAQVGFKVELLGIKELGEESFFRSGITPSSTLYIAHKV